MKRDSTIINDVKKSYWNKEFLEKVEKGELSGKEQYWYDTVLKFADLCLFRLRKEYSTQSHGKVTK